MAMNSVAMLPFPVVLVIDDNPGDVCILRMALYSSGIPNLRVVTDDGTTAVELCRMIGTDPNVIVPNVVLLDLNVGFPSGLDILKLIRANPYLVLTAVVIVSGSENARDITDSYALGANAYMFKRVDVQEMFGNVANALKYFWSLRRGNSASLEVFG